MTLPANLFVDTPEMEDVSLHHLGSDVESWPEEIVSKVKERLPQAATMSLMVKFLKKDDENGCATGSVVINSSDKVAIIPVIIKDFMLFPLDVMIAGSKLLPLTPDYFAAVFSNNKVFDKIEEFPTFGGLGRFEDANLWNSIYPPSLGRYAYASAGYPILDAVSDTIDGSELKAFLADPKNEKVAARLLSGPHKEVIVKLAHLQPVNLNEYRQGVENLIPRNVAMLRYDGPNKYTLLQNSDEFFHPSVMTLPRSEMHQAISTLSDHVDDDINDVDQNGEKFLRLPEGGDVILAKADQEIPESANEFDHYSVKNKHGVSIEGLVIPTVIDFNMKKQDLKLFVGKTLATVQPEIWGVRLKNSRFQLPRSEPRTGQTGVFVFMPKKSHALATVPFTIETITEYRGALEFKCVDLMGAPFTLKKDPSFELHTIVRIKPGVWQVPGSMFWVPTEGFTEVTRSPDDYAAKTAGWRKTDKPVTLIPTGSGFYSMRGVDKYAAACGWDKTMLSSCQAKFLLGSLGCPQVKIAAAFKEASRQGSSELHGLKFVPLASEKIAQARPLASALVKEAGKHRANLLKEASLLQNIPDVKETPWFKKGASYMENTQTLDAILSLNFVNPNNIMKYVGKLPSLKAAVSHLASCLLASRLGMQEIPDQACSAAMMRLVEVVNGLEKLRATQETNTQRG